MLDEALVLDEDTYQLAALRYLAGLSVFVYIILIADNLLEKIRFEQRIYFQTGLSLKRCFLQGEDDFQAL